MLPSMPILFTRDSQDAFGNRIEPSTSFFNLHTFEKPPITHPPQPPEVVAEVPKASKEIKGKIGAKKKDQETGDPPKTDVKVLETALVKSYYTKVQSRFSSHTNVPTNKFVQFQNILKLFDPSKETPIDLYKKIELLFGDEHKDIVEEFLLFLKPGQAAEIGRFMDYFVLNQMTGFIQSLQAAFARKPTVLRKVLRALTTGVNSGRVEDIKTRVLPHLRSNPRLTQQFKQLFADERPPESVYENGTDVVNEGFLANDKEYDVWEFDEGCSDKRNLEDKVTLDTTYLQGRVFLQHGRMLRSARVTYPYSKEPYRVHARRLAPTHCHLSPPESDDETTSPKRSKNTPKITPKRTKKLKSPTKAAKDVNDNTKKDVTNSPKHVRRTNKSKTIKAETQKGRKDKSSCKKEEAKAKQVKMETAAEKKQQSKIKSNWTRDEDKTMLQVLKGEAGSEQIFGKINQLLPHRTPTEIKERFCHVMNLLQQMAVAEVT